ncbi:MAG: hypothetical protein ACRDR6_11420 [Pseudonocardiaceae bacterium]
MEIDGQHAELLPACTVLMMCGSCGGGAGRGGLGLNVLNLNAFGDQVNSAGDGIGGAGGGATG